MRDALHCDVCFAGASAGARSGFSGEEWTHKVWAFALLTVAPLAFVPGYLRHGRKAVPALVAVGLLLVLFAVFTVHHKLGEQWEDPLTGLGSITLIAAHMTNRSFCRHCPVREAAPSVSH